jgi:hypothetical protein
MGCLLAALVVVALVVTIVTAAWIGFGAVGAIVTGIGLLLLLAVFGPWMLAAGSRWAFQSLGANMGDATVVIHSAALADPPDDVPEMLERLDAWIEESRADEESSGPLSIEVDEFLGGSDPEFNLDHARYLIDVTITPPATEPHTDWVPVVLSVAPTAEPGAFAGGSDRIELFDKAAATFRPCSDEQAAEVRGSQRLRLRFSLDPRQREYQFVYMHVNRIGPTFEVPAPAWTEEPRRRFTVQAVGRIVARRNVGSLSLNYLPVVDADLIKIAALADLEFLGLDSTQISDEGLKHLTRLEKLEGLMLSSTRITGAGLTCLHALKRLKRLWLSDTAVTDAALRQLKQALPQIEIIR